MTRDLNELAAEIHAANSHWWHNLETGERLDRNKGEMLMLIVSELAEAMEGERKGLRDDHLPWRMMAEVELADAMIRILDFAGGFGYSLSVIGVNGDAMPSNKGESLVFITSFICDAYYCVLRNDPNSEVIRCLENAVDGIYAYAAKFGYDVDGAMEEKRAYNDAREDHKKEARLAANGKKW